MSRKNLINRYYGSSFSNQESQPRERDRDYSYKGYYLENTQPESQRHKFSEKFTTKSPTINEQKQREEWSIKDSPNSRSFLRHTTYLAKGQSFLDTEKSSLSISNVGKPRKDSWDIQHVRLNTSYSCGYDQPYKNNLNIYGDQKYDKVASKVKETANYIEELKKYKEGYSKGQYAAKSELGQTLPSFKSYKTATDLNFKKKDIRHDFYTPKPESCLNYNQDKFKRIYSPEVEVIKVVSPSYKKTLQAVSIKDFIIDGKLGGGKFGTVHKAIHIKTRSIYAIKKIPKAIIKENMMIDQFILEFKLQSFLRHQNILQVYGMFDDKEHLYLILQYMPDGTLYALLKKRKILPQKEAAFKIKQIAKAIVFMHDQGIVHRDIKPQNIVMSGSVCKLCDFGWATICQDRRKTYCGTFDYAAPEILEGAQYDMTVDLWCLGVLSFQLLAGKAPFYHISRKETINNILNVDTKKITFPSSVSSSAKSFIECLLKRNPKERLGYDDILQHPFLLKVQEE